MICPQPSLMYPHLQRTYVVEVIPIAETSARAALEASKQIHNGPKNRLFGGAADASL